MAEKWRGKPPPDGPGLRVYDVIAPRPGETFDLTILDGLILGLDCHWVMDEDRRSGRSRLCTADEGVCPWCEKERRLWLGWLAVIDNRRRGRAILRLGKESALTLAGRAEQFAGLRGLRLNVKRSIDNRTSSLLYETSSLAAQFPLPEPHDMVPTLCLVLGCGTIPNWRVTGDDIERRA